MSQVHPMTQAFKECPEKFLALTIWAVRKHIKNLAVLITSDDMAKLASLGQFTITLRGKHDSIEVQIVDAATGKALADSPDGALDNPAAVQMAKFREMQKRAPEVAKLLENDLSIDMKNPAVSEAVEMLKFWGNEKKFE